MSKSKGQELIYQLDGKPSLGVAIPLGLQHVLAMFTGNLAPIFVLAGAVGLDDKNKVLMIQCAMFVSGITSLIQLYPIKIGKFQIGAGLPIVMGTSFAFVPTMINKGKSYTGSGVSAVDSIGIILGGTLLGGFVEIIMGLFIKPLKRFFPPLVVGSVLVVIGVNLLQVGATYFGGGEGAKFAEEGSKAFFASKENLILGFTVFFIVVLLQKFAKGMMKMSAILIGIVIGYIIAIPMGMVNFDSVNAAGIFSVPMPLQFNMSFRLDAIISFATLYIVSGLETIGNTGGITIAAFDREATGEETSGALIADAVGSMVAAVFNTLPNTAYGQNAGIVAMTKVVNKFCIATGAGFLILAAFIPKIGAIFGAMPSAVLGGAVITVFATIFINGVKMISLAGFSEGNLLALGVTFGIGYGVFGNELILESLPHWFSGFMEDSVVAVCVTSILANIIFNFKNITQGNNSKLSKELAKDL